MSTQPRRLAGPPLPPLLHLDHEAQFFADDETLVEHVTAFATGSLATRGAVILLVTRAHADAIEREIGQMLDLEPMRATGRYRVIVAEDALAALMRDGMPDPVVFRDVVGTAVAATEREFGSVFAYGELVGVLWSRGERRAVAELERLWNELIRVHPVSLLCGYPFHKTLDAEGFSIISSTHRRTAPPSSLN